jgi:hypothetical protein
MQAFIVYRDPVCLAGQRQLLGFTDGNGTGLERLRQFARQLDGQQTMLQLGALHFHVLAQLEGELEVTLGNPLMEELTLTGRSPLRPFTLRVPFSVSSSSSSRSKPATATVMR